MRKYYLIRIPTCKHKSHVFIYLQILFDLFFTTVYYPARAGADPRRPPLSRVGTIHRSGGTDTLDFAK